ncbi:MAG: DNA mismatch repair protein MutS [Muribaculaceae bacterium]|nr:DNA mismatch repair protein MutS [Muribaculaceae bacterium]
MQLKNVIESPCGLRFMVDGLDLQSGFARRWLLDSEMMTIEQEITTTYDVLRHFVDFVHSIEPSFLNTLLFRLQGVKDIRTTIKNLRQSSTLDDIELFEVKHLAILSTEVVKLLKEHNLDKVVDIPSLDEVITILDPDGMKIASFYIYDSYCEQLKDLRIQMRKNPEQQDELLIEAAEIEEGVRQDLTRQLHSNVDDIECALVALAKVDIGVAKARQIVEQKLCFPEISVDGTSHYSALFHPQVKDALGRAGKQFQPVNISFAYRPTLITGANMGGKTVVLKTLTLCQYLFQFGFGIPASEACIAIKDEIMFCIGDEQSIEKGLSSFAAEMKNIDAVIKASREKRRLLALIDEPARTTNPTEGTALVQALLKVLATKQMSLVMTTHYDIEPGSAHCLRVKGFDNGLMNYSLVEVDGGDVPHEALNIAQSLGIDPEWIDLARHELEKSE